MKLIVSVPIENRKQSSFVFS